MPKSEYALDQISRHLEGRGPVTIDSLVANAWLFTDDGDPRWIGAALSRLDRDGKVRHVTCDPNHQHNDTCTVELIGA